MEHRAVFLKLRSLLRAYETTMDLQTDNDNTYYLNYPLDNPKAKPEMFAAVMIQKHYVSLYYMPIYRDPTLLANISPELKKRMQGKSCFNFTDENDATLAELENFIKQTAFI